MRYSSFSAFTDVCRCSTRRRGSVALVLLLLVSWMYAPQPATAQADATSRLAGLTPKQVLDGSAQLVGPYAPDQKLRLALGLERPHPAEEEQFLEELHTKGSPNFMRFMTLKQWIARFSPSPQNEQAIVDWAKSQGLTVTQRYPNRLLVDVE